MIVFDELKHEYRNGDVVLISVTQLLKKHHISTNYGNVNPDVLKAKAERGTLVHAEIEDYIKNGADGFTKELADFKSICADNNLKPLTSETMASRGYIAGTIDLTGEVNGESFIADVKTTYLLNKKSCRWQLSIYGWLLNKQFDHYYIYHFSKTGAKLVELEPIPVEEIEKLILADVLGEEYKEEL